MSKPVQNGLIVGAITIAIFLMAYLYDKELMLHPMLSWGTLGVYIWFMMAAAKEPSQVDIREGISAAFKIFVVANMLFYTFYYVLMNHIDPSLSEIQLAMMEKYAEGRDIEVPKELDNSISATAFSYVRSLIGGFIISAIIAFVYNRK